MTHRLTLGSVLAALLACTIAAPLKGLDRQTVQDEYDFIIAGGGPTGPVLANRLTKSGKNQVLLKSSWHTSHRADINSLAAPPFTGASLDDRILRYYRGNCLGGSSAINGFYYGRGTSMVYDDWVTRGNPGWGWDDIYPLFDPSAYSDGPLKIGFQGYVPPSGVGFIEASAEALRVPIVEDYNTGNSTGVKQGTAQVDGKFERSSSYDGYLKEALGRPNLDVLHDAPVWKINFDTTGDRPRATGVAFTDHPTGIVHDVYAKKEVIVSAGAFNLPQLLMGSLEKYGIDIVHINENIGQHLNDHSVFSIMALSTPEFSSSDMAATYADLRAAQLEFYSNLTGQYTAPSCITNAFQRLSAEELREIGAEAIIDAGLENQSHIEYPYERVFYPNGPTPYYTPKGNETYISLTASSMVALSRGNVTLQSNSVAELFAINRNGTNRPQYYADPTDAKIATASFKYLRKILAHPRMAQYTMGPNDGENTVPNWHASGTNQMLLEADGGVVDPSLKVSGVDGLRVCDCSIIPVLPRVNIVATVFMIGEKGAQLIRRDWGDL
ncbi:GMC oxidoreductase [Phyllosticta citrichinensis]|uniref:GMC oxidoreductase n=1 Tax=Phyllosticta citrichinensis TaxID=1130410 RepID=A0ABR1Y6W3_9PEZI